MWSIFLEWRECGGNKDQRVEPEFLARLPAENQMAVMNRIERTAVDAYFFQTSLIIDAVTTNACEASRSAAITNMGDISGNLAGCISETNILSLSSIRVY